jgi:LysM repeat protein
VATVKEVTVNMAFAAFLMAVSSYLSFICPHILLNTSYILIMEKVVRVIEGDTAVKISKRYGVPAYIILKYNGVNEIREGMRLIIPEPRGEKYVVKPLDTLGSIARAYGVSEQKLVENNNGINSVFLGQIIYIPTYTGDGGYFAFFLTIPRPRGSRINSILER